MNPDNDIKQIQRLVTEGVVNEEELRNAPIIELPPLEEGDYISSYEAADILNVDHDYIVTYPTLPLRDSVGF